MRCASDIRRLLRRAFSALLLAEVTVAPVFVAGAVPPAFTKVVLATGFFAEGAGAGDLNRDGNVDVVAGPYWFAGPDFKERHEIYPAEKFDPNGYSKNFFAATYDVDADGWLDVLVIGFPGEATVWFENPRGREVPWERHIAYGVTGNESAMFADINGDGRPDLVCSNDSALGWAEFDPKAPREPWKFHALAPPSPKKLSKFIHGLGCGDINGDGRPDVIERTGWWEQPSSLADDPIWKKHPFVFANGRGGAQMCLADLSGDGLPDIVTSIDAHGYGLSWFEQLRPNADTITWREHIILPPNREQESGGVQFSQLHAVALADLDGNGQLDVVTGKRWWAHGPAKDPEADGASVLYAFYQLAAGDNGPKFFPALIDDDSGVGTQFTVADLNSDGRLDLVTANKKGIFVFLAGKHSP